MDWNKRLKRAEKRGEFTPVDKRLARDWTSCAVGENRGSYKEGKARWDDEAEPYALGLSVAGCNFYAAVSMNNVVRARVIYDRIQAWFRRYGKAA